MVNRRYRQGYIFEKKTAQVLRDVFVKYPQLLYYIIESRGSHGKADIIVGLYSQSNGVRTWFGVQCKKGYISRPEQRRAVTEARTQHGMFLFHATQNKEKKLVITPDIEPWLNSWITEIS